MRLPLPCLSITSLVRAILSFGLMGLFSYPVPAQEIIPRYTVYTGFDYMISPARNLTERGFDVDFGVIVKPWLGLGGDFSAIGEDIFSGAGTINGSETIYAKPVAGLGIPPSSIHVPFKSTTYTFAAGPQFYFRKWPRITLFARPGLGGIHEKANLTFPPQLGPLFEALQLPPPAEHQTDTTWFVGVGGGFDVNVNRWLGLRFTTDWVNTHLFSDLLTNRQNYVRFTIGPAFRWGELKH
ncbi:MAG TPA: hypothetical protein VMJ35_12700 [Dongiaceae bacterium]|nr:hypothetical protein [Dongiaceae bacterium]